MKIELKILNKEFYKEGMLPSYATPGSAAMDLMCTEDVVIYPGVTKAIHTGLAIYIKDPNVVGVINPRSGLGTKGLVLANIQGWVDSDYQGELIVQAWNRNGSKAGLDWANLTINYSMLRVELKAGDRFAQLMFVPMIKAQWDVVEEFSNTTERGTGGFGSTDSNGKPKC